MHVAIESVDKRVGRLMFVNLPDVRKIGVLKRAVYGSSLILITGMIQREGEVVHIIARTAVDFSHMLSRIGDRNNPLQVPHQPADEFRNGERGIDLRVARLEKAQIKHRSRDFR